RRHGRRRRPAVEGTARAQRAGRTRPQTRPADRERSRRRRGLDARTPVLRAPAAGQLPDLLAALVVRRGPAATGSGRAPMKRAAAIALAVAAAAAQAVAQAKPAAPAAPAGSRPQSPAELPFQFTSAFSYTFSEGDFTDVTLLGGFTFAWPSLQLEIRGHNGILRSDRDTVRELLQPRAGNHQA